jgi:acyl carrier protein
MSTLEKLKIIVENESARSLDDNEISSTWEELDLDSLSMISILRDVEDEFNIVLEYNILKDHKITCINDFSEYIDKKL